MNIALIDDHALLTETLTNVLRQHIKDADIRVFKNGAAFFATDFKEWEPELVILDMLMPGLTGLEVMDRGLLDLGQQCRFILLSSIVDIHTIKNALRLGARGYLSKETSIDELLDAIAAVQKGERYIGRSLRDGMIKYAIDADPVVFHLAPREKEMLDMLCSGKTPKEIAYETHLSLNTVQGYIRNIMNKFKVHRTADLIRFAIQKGLHNPASNK